MTTLNLFKKTRAEEMREYLERQRLLYGISFYAIPFYANPCVFIVALIFLMTSSGAAQATAPAQTEIPWARDLANNPALMTEFGRLMEKLQHGVQFPAERSQSRLLTLQQGSTVFYSAFPNYGDTIHQALTIFQGELHDSAVLRTWWQHGDLAVYGPKVEDALEKAYELSQFLGDEITVSAGTEGRQGPSLQILAEIRKPGLEDFLRQMAKQLASGSKPPFHVFNMQELGTAKEMFPPQQPVILVRPDLLVGTLDLGELKRLNAHLDRTGVDFTSTPFGQRVARTYEGGATSLGAVDLQTILKQIPTNASPGQALFHHSGFNDMKYLVWEHERLAGRSSSEMELSFNGPRHGMALWLATPGPLRSLDFVSPHAIMASAILLRNPAQIYDDVKELATASNPKAFASVEQMEAALKVNLKEDLLSRLGGEIAFELDSLNPPDPEWEAMLQVNDPDRLQSTLSTLLTATHLNVQRSREDGVTYYTVRIPSAGKTLEIGYAFVDGYLLIASNHEGVAGAVRLHRSGESLGRSQKFLATLPPGSGPDASAVFYETPNALAAMNMRRFFPQLSESLSRSTAEAPPIAVYGYGEESALREVSTSGGVDASVILVGAAIAIPNLLRARMAANEASAVAMIRTANTAQIAYSSSYPQRGFARDLATLGPDPARPAASTAERANLIDPTLGNPSCTADAWCVKSGFQFSVSAVCKKQLCQQYVVVGTPVSSSTGSRNFCSTSDAVIRFKIGLPLTTPVSSTECGTWAPLQ